MPGQPKEAARNHPTAVDKPQSAEKDAGDQGHPVFNGIQSAGKTSVACEGVAHRHIPCVHWR